MSDNINVVGPLGASGLQFKADLVRLYCTRFGLIFRDKTQEPVSDREEWDEVECVGFDSDPEYGANIIHVTSGGEIRVITHFADGRGLLEDRYQTVTLAELFRAIITNVDIHPK